MEGELTRANQGVQQFVSPARVRGSPNRQTMQDISQETVAQELDRLRVLVSLHDEELATMERQKVDAELRATEQAAEIETLSFDLSSSQDREKTLISENQVLVATASKLQSDLDITSLKVEAGWNELAKFTRSGGPLEVLQNDRDKLKLESDGIRRAMATEIESLQNELRAVIETSNVAKTKYTQIEEEYNKLMDENTKQKAELAAVQTNLRDALEETNELKGEVKSLKSSLQDAETKIEEKEIEMQRRSDMLRMQDSELATMRGKFEEMSRVSSTSTRKRTGAINSNPTPRGEAPAQRKGASARRATAASINRRKQPKRQPTLPKQPFAARHVSGNTAWTPKVPHNFPAQHDESFPKRQPPPPPTLSEHSRAAKYAETDGADLAVSSSSPVYPSFSTVDNGESKVSGKDNITHVPSPVDSLIGYLGPAIQSIVHDQLKERLIGKDLTELLQGATTESGANTSTEYTPSIAITELPETPKHLRFKTSVASKWKPPKWCRISTEDLQMIRKHVQVSRSGRSQNNPNKT